MTSDPLLCSPEEKAELEARNGVDQLDYLSYLMNERHIEHVREPHVLELHQLAIQQIYPCGGKYRDARHQVFIEGSGHTVPEPARVPSLIIELVERINDMRVPALERAAYALWRFNWIHPFNGGNGRTARALTYLILCMDMSTMPPGHPSFPSIIYDRRGDYVAALREADQLNSDGQPNLAAMCELVEDAITRQLANAVASLRTK